MIFKNKKSKEINKTINVLFDNCNSLINMYLDLRSSNMYLVHDLKFNLGNKIFAPKWNQASFQIFLSITLIIQSYSYSYRKTWRYKYMYVCVYLYLCIMLFKFLNRFDSKYNHHKGSLISGGQKVKSSFKYKFSWPAF